MVLLLVLKRKEEKEQQKEKKEKEDKMKKRIAALLVVAIGIFSSATIIIQSAEAYIDPASDLKTEPKAPAVISGENVYIVWWTDKGTPNTNAEVMFRASTDGGATFGNKTNLSNTDAVDSINAEIAAEGDTVVVSWWETANQTSDIPVARISTDAGETFGPMIMLATNGTISSTEEEGDEGETVQDAVEEAAAGEGGG
jgi:hypothetical protein